MSGLYTFDQTQALRLRRLTPTIPVRYDVTDLLQPLGPAASQKVLWDIVTSCAAEVRIRLQPPQYELPFGVGDQRATIYGPADQDALLIIEQSFGVPESTRQDKE